MSTPLFASCEDQKSVAAAGAARGSFGEGGRRNLAPSSLEHTQENVGRLGAGDGVALGKDEERYARDAQVSRLLLICAHLATVGVTGEQRPNFGQLEANLAGHARDHVRMPIGSPSVM